MQPKARIYRGTPVNVARLAAALRRGELVAVPTETVYGLAGNALDAGACARIFSAKGRPGNDPLIVHLHALDQLDALALRSPEVDALAAAFWPGPLTLVLPKTERVPDIVTSGRPSVAIRIPAHPLFRKLLRATGLPLAAPSANPFGYISPTTAGHVAEGLGLKIRHILDGGACRIGLESTILDLRDPRRPVILRPGAIERADLERVLKRRVHLPRRRTAPAAAAALAPGMLSRHYSPRTPLVLHRRVTPSLLRTLPDDEALLLQGPLPASIAPRPNFVSLSPAGDPEEAARALFAALRGLDRGGWSRLHAETAHGRSALALAINDRLARAAARR